MNFIDKLIDYTKDAESPTEFWRWGAIGAIAAVLRDNIFIECQIGTIYPNLYIILFSDSGIARKAAPCKFAGKLVQKVGNTKFIGGRASMQAVVKELGTTITSENGNILNGASGMLYSEELSSFMVDDPACIPLLIELYDHHERWASKLISQSYALKDVCLTLLAASNSKLFNSVYTESAISGGLLGRTLIIQKDAPRHRKSLLDLKNGSKEIDIFGELVKHLVKLSTIKGPIQFDKAAETECNEWYYAMPDEVFQDKIGFGARMQTHAIKVAMSLAAARDDFDRIIMKDDIMQAIDLIQTLRGTYKTLSFGVGSSTNSQKAGIIIKAVVKCRNYHIDRQKLIQRCFGDIGSVQELDEILLLLVQGDILTEKALDNKVAYQLTAKGLMMLQGESNDVS